MKTFTSRCRQLGQGMTEYIIIVALIAIAAIAVYTAFGGVIRGQTAVAAATLAGNESTGARTRTTAAGDEAHKQGEKKKTLKDFQEAGESK